MQILLVETVPLMDGVYIVVWVETFDEICYNVLK